jgi:hypothetical protein
MYTVKAIKPCSCYELDGQEETYWVEVEHGGRNKEDLVFKREKVDFFIHPRAISG